MEPESSGFSATSPAVRPVRLGLPRLVLFLLERCAVVTCSYLNSLDNDAYAYHCSLVSDACQYALRQKGMLAWRKALLHIEAEQN